MVPSDPKPTQNASAGEAPEDKAPEKAGPVGNVTEAVTEKAAEKPEPQEGVKVVETTTEEVIGTEREL